MRASLSTGLRAVAASLASALFLSATAFARDLPQEFFGFRLGEPIEAVSRPDGSVTVKSRTMVVATGAQHSVEPRVGPDIVVYQDCLGRVVAGKCQPGAEKPDGQGVDQPGSLRLFVARFAGSRLLALAFRLNNSQWQIMPLEKAGALFVKEFGVSTRSTPPKSSTVQTPQLKLVTSSASWLWQDNEARLHMLGYGNNLPGTAIPLTVTKPEYSYTFYIERIDLRGQADARRPPAPTEK